MSHTTRQQFVASIREALGKSAASPTTVPVAPAVADSLARLTKREDDFYELFVKRAAENGLTMIRTTAAQLTHTVLGILSDIEAKSVTVALSRLAQGAALTEAVRGKGITIANWKGDATMASHYVVQAGISDVHAALADSGSLVCNSGPEHGRGHSLVVPMHIAIVRRSDVVPDMLDYLATVRGLGPAQLPSAQAIITGPSKTADIEGVLITGIHGPFKVFALLVEDE